MAMLTYPVFSFNSLVHEGVRDLLATIGGRPDSLGPGWLVTSEAEQRQVEEVLDRHGVSYDVYFSVTPAPGTPSEELAAYVSLEPLDECKVGASDLVLACDGDLSRVVASASLISRLRSRGIAIAMSSNIRHDGLYSLDSFLRLPDPVHIQRVMFQSQALDGLWAIQSDGREIVTRRSLETIRTSGLAITTSCYANGREFQWRRPLIASGIFLDAIRAEVVGVSGPPTFLIVE